MEKKVILLVDDDALVRELVRDALQGEKYMVLGASNYSEALRHLESPFHLALIDYSLPQYDGLDVLRAVREKYPAMPAVVMTGYSSESVAIKALRAGVNDYLKKPFCLSHLVSKISEILEPGRRGRSDQPETVESRDKFILDGAAAYIEDNYTEQISLHKLAAITGFNKYKFSRLFKERHKCGFVAYMNRIRIGNSLDLLTNSDLSITEIALSVGYGSIQHFERVFIKHQGIAPREYRRKLKQQGL